MELFGAISRGSSGALTEDEIKALEAGDLDATPLPEGVEAQLLAETAKSILGLESGKKKKFEVEPGDEEEG
jgi:hypothetical protein